MDDKTIQRKLNQLRKISNELVEEAKERYGKDGQLFYECEGYFHLMDGDDMNGAHARQNHSRFRSSGPSRMGCGAW